METKRIKGTSKTVKAAEFYEHLPLETQLTQYNMYCHQFNYGNDCIFPVKMFDEIMSVFTPTEIATKVRESKCDLTAPYFGFDGNDNVKAYSEWEVISILIDHTYPIADEAVRDFRKTGGHTTWLCGCMEKFLKGE